MKKISSGAIERLRIKPKNNQLYSAVMRANLPFWRDFFFVVVYTRYNLLFCLVVCDFTLKIDPDVFNRWWLNFDWGVLCRLGLVWRTRRRRRAQAPNILRRYSLGVLPRGACLRRRRSRFSYAPPELDSSKLWFFCYILIVYYSLWKRGEVEQAQVWIRRRRRVWPAACMCVAFMTEAPAVHKQSLFSTTPRSIWYANVRKFQYRADIRGVWKLQRESSRMRW